MESSKCRVTVGIPVYNAMQHLPFALEAILKQSYDKLIILISDNCSTDGTYEFCCDIAKKDSRVVVTRNDSNVGAYENFILLINRCETEYFFWAASDDLFDKRFVERAVEVLDDASDAGLVFCHFRILNHATDNVGALITPLPSASDSAARRLFHRLINPNASLIYGLHRASVLKGLIKNLSKFDYFDYYLIQEIAAKAPIFVIPLDMYRLGVKTTVRVPYASDGKKIRVRAYLLRSIHTIKKYSFGLERILLLSILIFVVVRFWVNRPKPPEGDYIRL